MPRRAGEVHLEACLLDLRTRFARVPLRASPPVVRFRESVAHPAEAPPDAPAGAPLPALLTARRSALCAWWLAPGGSWWSWL